MEPTPKIEIEGENFHPGDDQFYLRALRKLLRLDNNQIKSQEKKKVIDTINEHNLNNANLSDKNYYQHHFINSISYLPLVFYFYYPDDLFFKTYRRRST